MKKWYQYRCEEAGIDDMFFDDRFLDKIIEKKILSGRLRQFLVCKVFTGEIYWNFKITQIDFQSFYGSCL